MAFVNSPSSVNDHVMSCSWIDAIFVAAAKDAESPKPSALSNETALTSAGAVTPLQMQQQRNCSDEPSSEKIMQLMAEIEWTEVEIALRAHVAQDSVSEEAPLATVQGRLDHLVRKLQQEQDSDDVLLRQMSQLRLHQSPSPAFMCA